MQFYKKYIRSIWVHVTFGIIEQIETGMVHWPWNSIRFATINKSTAIVLILCYQRGLQIKECFTVISPAKKKLHGGRNLENFNSRYGEQTLVFGLWPWLMTSPLGVIFGPWTHNGTSVWMLIAL